MRALLVALGLVGCTSAAGPAGPQGPPGERGEKGERGVVGPTGPVAPPVFKCPPGDRVCGGDKLFTCTASGTDGSFVTDCTTRKSKGNPWVCAAPCPNGREPACCATTKAMCTLSLAAPTMGTYSSSTETNTEIAPNLFRCVVGTGSLLNDCPTDKGFLAIDSFLTNIFGGCMKTTGWSINLSINQDTATIGSGMTPSQVGFTLTILTNGVGRNAGPCTGAVTLLSTLPDWRISVDVTCTDGTSTDAWKGELSGSI